jgi:uncharacterized protein YciI
VPLGDNAGALLIIEAESDEAVHERLGRDPWRATGHLVTARVTPWEILLGSL